MAKVDEITKRFWNKLIVAYVKYYPKRIKNVGLEGEIARSLVYSFKSGESQEIVAQETAKRLKETFGDKVEELVFTCVPTVDCSSMQTSVLRTYEQGKSSQWHNKLPISGWCSSLIYQ